MKVDSQKAVTDLLCTKAPRRKQKTLIPAKKRVKKREIPPEEAIGIKINEKRTCNTGFQKGDFSIWKPWLQEDSKLPQWAKDLGESDLKTVLTHKSAAG